LYCALVDCGVESEKMATEFMFGGMCDRHRRQSVKL